MSKSFRALFCAAAVAVFAQPVQAAWPDDRPIEVVVGFVAGGGTDVMARKLLPHLEKRLEGKAKFVVLNKPGAAGEIATTAVARAAPDGYTIGVVNVPTYLFLPMMKKTPYSTDDFRLLARVVDDPTVMVVNAKSRFKDLKGVVDALREKPSSVTSGTTALDRTVTWPH